MSTALPELDSVSEEERSRCIITATRRGFSSSPKNEESEFNDYVVDNEDFKLFFSPKFYANGDCEENEDYVSILFCGSDDLIVFIFQVRIEVNFTVAVVDAGGNKRFRQTLSYFSDLHSSCHLKDHFAKFGLDRYLKRETLCNEPSELLPDDCLTVYLEIDFIVNGDRGKSLRFSLEEIVRTNGLSYVNLDSTFGRELRQVSDFFKCASDTPMKESETRLVCIPSGDIDAFNRIYLELKGGKEIEFHSIEDVCDMYTVGDKYCIQPVVETSKQIIKSFLCRLNDKTFVEHVVKSIPVLLELAEKHDDENLKGMISMYLETKNKFEKEERKQCLHVFEEHMKEKLVTDWTCEHVTFMDYNFFRLKRMRCNVKGPGMEFYK